MGAHFVENRLISYRRSVKILRLLRQEYQIVPSYLMTKPTAMVGVSLAIRTIEEDVQYASRSDAKVMI